MQRSLASVFASLVLACAACSSSSAPSIKITMPTAGASIAYDADNTDVDVSFTTKGIVLKDPGSCGGASGCGHVELFLDGATCNDHSDPTTPQPFNGTASSSPTTVGLDYCPTFPAVDGTHTLRAELHKDDLSPILGSNGQPISDQVSFMAMATVVDLGPPDFALNTNCGTDANPILVGPGHGFAPDNCAVAAGATVHWTWNGDTHSVSSDPISPVSFDSGLKASGTFTYVVPAGTASGTIVNYHCNNHASTTATTCTGMCAQLVVQ